MRTFDNYGERFDGQGTMILVTDHLAIIKEKDTVLAIKQETIEAQTNRLIIMEAAMKEKDARIEKLFEDCGKERDKVFYLTADLKERDEKIARMEEHTWCAYCGYEIHIDDEASTKISEHIMSCEKHPIHIAFAEIEWLRELVRKSEGMANEINILTKENNALASEIKQLKAELAPSIPDEEESVCRLPCDSDTGCPECSTTYWQRMVEEGYWDNNEHKWTDKGWKEIVK